RQHPRNVFLCLPSQSVFLGMIFDKKVELRFFRGALWRYFRLQESRPVLPMNRFEMLTSQWSRRLVNVLAGVAIVISEFLIFDTSQIAGRQVNLVNIVHLPTHLPVGCMPSLRRVQTILRVCHFGASVAVFEGWKNLVGDNFIPSLCEWRQFAKVLIAQW